MFCSGLTLVARIICTYEQLDQSAALHISPAELFKI